MVIKARGGGAETFQGSTGIRGEVILQFAGFRRDKNDPSKPYTFPNAAYGYTLKDGVMFERATGRQLEPDEAAANTEMRYVADLNVIIPEGHEADTLPYSFALKGIEILAPDEFNIVFESKTNIAGFVRFSVACGLDSGKMTDGLMYDEAYCAKYAAALVEPVTKEQVMLEFVERALLDAAAEGWLVRAKTSDNADWLQGASFRALSEREASDLWAKVGRGPTDAPTQAEEETALPFDGDDPDGFDRAGLEASVRGAVGEGVVDIVGVEGFLDERGLAYDSSDEGPGILGSLSAEGLTALAAWVEGQRAPKGNRL
jgi:hypothetical protein